MYSDESWREQEKKSVFRLRQESLVAAFWPRCIQWECGPLPLTLECAMMISTRNRDEKYGPPFVNGLGTFEKEDPNPDCARGTMQKIKKTTPP